MARRLNIERRRKRIRHYTAKRRLRSPLHRALLFWWGPLLLLTVTALLLAGPLVTSLGKSASLGQRFGELYLPGPGLRLVRAAAADVAEVIRAGNVKRLAVALSDSDVGISMALPEIADSPAARLPLVMPERLADRNSGLSPTAFLPAGSAADMAPEASRAGMRLRVGHTLGAADYAPEVSDAVWAEAAVAEALFEVVLAEDGRVAAVFRLRPAGAETEGLRKLRMLLEHGRGSRAASGLVWLSTNGAGT